MPTRTVATRRVAVITSALLLTMAVGACGATTHLGPRRIHSLLLRGHRSRLVLDDGWVKAVDAGGTTMSSPSPSTSTAGGMDEMVPMTGMFGTLATPPTVTSPSLVAPARPPGGWSSTRR